MDSMTAFANLEESLPAGRLAWDLRGVNHRFLDISLRLPEGFRSIEAACHERLKAALRRGKCELTLRFERDGSETAALVIDEVRLADVLAACRGVAERWSGESRLDPLAVLAWPGVVEPRVAAGVPTEAALDLLDRVLEDFCRCRRREGRQIATLIEARCERAVAEVGALRQALPELLAAHRRRLESRLSELRDGFDEGRLEQEMAVLAQRSDVEEELDRIETHVAEVRRLLAAEGPVGRRLDFLMQELHREANTLGSKASSIETTRAAVELKVVIEQMREQVQNVE